MMGPTLIEQREADRCSFKREIVEYEDSNAPFIPRFLQMVLYATTILRGSCMKRPMTKVRIFN